MARYFLELAYFGGAYSGFQTQKNTPKTIQAEVEKALEVLLKTGIELTGSSRTDAGVHALQNFFHFDYDSPLADNIVYKLNAILPCDISVKDCREMPPDAHCRFDAASRLYQYYIYQKKNPFLTGRAFYYPYPLQLDMLNEAAEMLLLYTNFTSFSKRNTQVKTFNCKIIESSWRMEDGCLIYTVQANRFLRGMVRALVATMLKVGRGTISIDRFKEIIEAEDCTKAYFAVPPQGLFLKKVIF